jgi:HlyD family secretion protein
MVAEKQLLEELRIDRGARHSRSPWRLALILAAPAILLVAAALFFWLRGAQAAEVRVAAVREARAAGQGTVLNASGYVTARRRATVSSKITGKVIEVLIEEGKSVQEGQVVGRLDDSIPRANMALTEAQLVAARRAVVENEVRLREANINLRRTKALVAEGVVSQSNLDTAEAEADAWASRLVVSKEEITVAEKQVALRRQDIEDSVIRAPFSGMVTTKDAQPGEMISPVSAGGGFTRTGICTIVDMKSLEIQVDVNESYIARVVPGQRVEATLDAYPDWKIPAHVLLPVPTADRQKATVQVRITFDHHDPRILPDMGVKVAFLEMASAGNTTPAPRLLVPKAAVRRENGRDFVYVVQQDRVERRAVTVGEADGSDVAVTGVNAGERVVIEGPQNLADGNRVAVR